MCLFLPQWKHNEAVCRLMAMFFLLPQGSPSICNTQFPMQWSYLYCQLHCSLGREETHQQHTTSVWYYSSSLFTGCLPRLKISLPHKLENFDQNSRCWHSNTESGFNIWLCQVICAQITELLSKKHFNSIHPSIFCNLLSSSGSRWLWARSAKLLKQQSLVTNLKHMLNT